MPKFTTKQYHPTGPYASFDHIYADLKFNKKICGNVCEMRYEEWRVGLMIKRKKEDVTPESPCKWHWIYLKKKFKSIKAVKEFFNSQQENIFKIFDLYFDEET